MLTFLNMDHHFYFSGSGSFDQFCLQDLSTSDTPNPALYIQSSPTSKLPLGNFLELRNEGQLTISYDRDRPGFAARLNSVAVSILEASFITNIAIKDDTLSFSIVANIFNSYSTNLTVSAPTNEAPWDRLPLNIHGELNSGPGSFIETLENRIHAELESRANMAQERQVSAEMGRERTLEQVSELERQFSDAISAVDTENQTREDTLVMLAEALTELDDAQRAFDNSSEQINQLRNNLDNLCMEMDCEEVCMEGCKPGVCYEQTFTTVTGQCPYIEYVKREVRVAPFYEVRRVWRWMTVCRDRLNGDSYVCSGECQSNEDVECTGICTSVTEREPVYNNVTRNVPVQRSRDCPVAVYSGTQPVPCCEPTECAVKRPNDTCLDTNVKCQAARKAAVQQLEQTQRDSIAPFRRFDQARSNVVTARSAVSSAELRLELANQRLRQIEPAYENAKLAKGVAERSYQMILEEVGPDLQISELLSQHTVERILAVLSISFSTTIVTESPTLIPLDITYETPYNGRSYQNQTNFDFTEGSKELAFKKLTRDLIKEVFQDTSSTVRRCAKSSHRRARQAIEPEEVNANQLRFDENCAALNNARAFLQDIAGSLFRVNASIQTARDEIGAQNGDLLLVDSSNDFSSVNFTVLEMEFNVTVDIESLRETVSENEELRAYATLVSDYQNLTMELLQETEATTFLGWLTQVQILYDENSTVGGYPCLSFGDCLLVATSILEDVLEDTPRSNAASLLEELPTARDKLMKLATTTNLTITEALESVSPILSLAERSTKMDYWCNSLPVITVQPPPEVDVPTNGTLDILCEAESNLPASYQWKRNGNTIPGATSPNLILENLRRLDSANYTCQVSNDIGTVMSINVSVLVYELPEFYLTPVSTSVYEGTNAGAWFACNSTSWPYPGWRWFYRPTGDDSWSLIEGEDTNELLIPNPQKDSEGWYACETYTRHGALRSDPVYLRILPVTVSLQAIPMEFQIETDENNTCTLPELLAEVSNEIQQLVETEAVFVQGLAITQESDSEYTVTFSLVTNNVTGSNLHETPFVEIANRALPPRAVLQRSRTAIVNSIEDDDFRLECGGVTFSALPTSVTLQKLMYICPEGQQLRRDYLLCGTLLCFLLFLLVAQLILYLRSLPVSCEPGTFSSYREQSRVFGTEALTENVPFCQQCPEGTFEAGVGSSECTPCPEYHTTLSTGAVSVNECTGMAIRALTLYQPKAHI